MTIKRFFNKRELAIIIASFFVCLALLLYTFFYPNYYSMKSPVRFEIHHGQSVNSIIDSLYEAGIIPSRNNFKIAAFIYAQGKVIKAGRYLIPNGINYFDLLDLFTYGKCEEAWLVTIPEGATLEQMAGIFSRKIKLDSAEFIDLCYDKSILNELKITAPSLEGYLMPESYFFYDSTSPKTAIDRLHSQFKSFWTEERLARLTKMKMNMHQLVTMASIVDGESNQSAEFSRIAGVYYNRLKTGMRLQADPTVQYSLEGRWKRLHYKDLKVNSSYNTYLHAGLPPGPINNPGKDALLAALFPEKHSYYYFVADGKGGHLFSASLSEHNIKVRQYRKELSK